MMTILGCEDGCGGGDGGVKSGVCVPYASHSLSGSWSTVCSRIVMKNAIMEENMSNMPDTPNVIR